MTVDAICVSGREKPIILDYRQPFRQDDLCPDLLIEQFTMAVATLEHESESREVAMDWETFRFRLLLSDRDEWAVAAASVAALAT